MTTENKIKIYDYRINLMRQRGENMNARLIAKLERQKRSLIKEKT